MSSAADQGQAQQGRLTPLITSPLPCPALLFPSSLPRKASETALPGLVARLGGRREDAHQVFVSSRAVHLLVGARSLHLEDMLQTHESVGTIFNFLFGAANRRSAASAYNSGASRFDTFHVEAETPKFWSQINKSETILLHTSANCCPISRWRCSTARALCEVRGLPTHHPVGKDEAETSPPLDGVKTRVITLGKCKVPHLDLPCKRRDQLQPRSTVQCLRRIFLGRYRERANTFSFVILSRAVPLEASTLLLHGALLLRCVHLGGTSSEAKILLLQRVLQGRCILRTTFFHGRSFVVCTQCGRSCDAEEV